MARSSFGNYSDPHPFRPGQNRGDAVEPDHAAHHSDISPKNDQPMPHSRRRRKLAVMTCKHPAVGSQSSDRRAQIDCNWVFGSGSQSLQLGSKSLQTGSQTSASCARSLQMRPGNNTTGFMTLGAQAVPRRAFSPSNRGLCRLQGCA